MVEYIYVIFWRHNNVYLGCVKFQFNISKVTKVMSARGMMGQKGLGR